MRAPAIQTDGGATYVEGDHSAMPAASGLGRRNGPDVFSPTAAETPQDVAPAVRGQPTTRLVSYRPLASRD